jgi:predicted alpha/beta-hydrolase family hydrolase
VIRHEPEGGAGWTFVYAPGAGANIDDPFGAYAGKELAQHGVSCVRFQFPYQEAGKKSPDRPDILEATWRAVIEHCQTHGSGSRPDRRLAIGGRSMGGRIASQVVAQGVPVDALALFAYPLHPPGRPENARDAHLPSIDVPTLFCSGTNDAFASPDELRAAAAKVPRSAVHLLEAADHGFNAPKSSGRTRPEIWAEATRTLSEWLGSL